MSDGAKCDFCPRAAVAVTGETNQLLACAIHSVERTGLGERVIALVGDHVFDSGEWDTGVRKCRHVDHWAGYQALCHKAWLREQLPELFPV